MGCELVSFSNDSSNHWLRVIKYFSLGDIFVYSSDVVTLFKLSSKSAIITESNLTPPSVSFLFNRSINNSLLATSDFSILVISSSRFLFLFE